MTEPAADQIVAEKYRLTRILGQGGMGSVWEGVHASLGTRVAVKFIDKQYANSPEARTRFENEARAAAKLTSKHVVKVFDHGVTDAGNAYIVMEYLDGEPLDRRLERQGRLSPADTATILAQVCRGLANAHQAGIVHRDLKPENIFLVWDPEDQADVAKVVDFGIAKFEESSGVSSSTRTGLVLGTPYYMSPEQARGFKTLDLRSDLWSVGVIAYRCIVGTLPFIGEAMGDLLVKICVDPLPVPSKMAANIPQAFDAWFVRALAREPEDRFESAAVLSDALRAACGLGGSTHAYTALAAGGMAASEAVSTPNVGQLTPSPSDKSAARDPYGVTGTPLTRTAGGSLRPRGFGRGAWVAGLIGGVILTIGILALVTVAGGEKVEEAASDGKPIPAAEMVRTSISTGSPPMVSPIVSAVAATATPTPVLPNNAPRQPVLRSPPSRSPVRPVAPARKPSVAKSPEELLGY